MIESDLIVVESLDFSDNQTWLYVAPGDTGEKVDVNEWNLSCNWPVNDDAEYLKSKKELYSFLDNLLKNDEVALPDKHKFDSRTYVETKEEVERPSIRNIVEVASNPPSITLNPSVNKYLTYNKYNNPLGPIGPMLRLKTFNVDANTDNSIAVKEYAMKRRGTQDDDPQLEDLDVVPTADASDRLYAHVASRPINIELSRLAHNLHNTSNKGLTNVLNERGILNTDQSGEPLMSVSPPSLVSSLLMKSSETFNAESLEIRKSMLPYKDSGLPTSGRNSIDPMMTSMTLSILDEKEMSTSFLSQTTYPDNDSLLNDSLPPSLVSSVNSSYVVNSCKPKVDNTDSHILSSATFTHLEQSERLLSARPRCQLYNSYTKRDSGIRSTESYTKSREEACQVDQVKILNENSANKDSPKLTRSNEMNETVTLHYSNNKYKNKESEKENHNETFETDDTFYKDNGIQKPEALVKNSLNVILDKQELNEIKQAYQKHSLARKGLPTDFDKPLPYQVDALPIKTIQLPYQIITAPRQNVENVSELLEEPTREASKRNATFRKVSPKQSAMDTTVVLIKSDENQIIDINSATMNLIDFRGKSLQQDECGSQESAMVGSNESTDTGTFSSSSPSDGIPDATAHALDSEINSTPPQIPLRKGSKSELFNIHTTISPIYDTVDDKARMVRTHDLHDLTVINDATLVDKISAKRHILAGKNMGRNIPRPNQIASTNVGPHSSMAPPAATLRKICLPTSNKELNRIPGGNPTAVTKPRTLAGRGMVHRGVYASTSALNPTSTIPPHEDKQTQKPSVPALVRQGTETLRRERPHSQLVAPRDPPTSRTYSSATTAQTRVSRPTSVPPQTHVSVPVLESRPVTAAETRASALPRPSRLPAPRRAPK